jgi:BirA family biotin operon repressor/biotin-[acetyl-CoA-carboxylase] ligase
VSETFLGRLGTGWPDPVLLEETGSTNDDLKARARAGAPEWTALLARRQRAGRGRLGREWVSPEGNLFVSVLLRPEAALAGLLPLTAGLAVAEALEGVSIDARLKWPNDVLVGERKIAGILAEGLSSGESLEAVVIGIGVNLALDPLRLPTDLQDRVTSVLSETGVLPDRLEVAAAVLLRLRLWYDALRLRGPEAIMHAVHTRFVPWWGEPVEVISGDERIVGLARDLDRRGGLVLELEDGSLRTVVSGEACRLRRVGLSPAAG